MPKTPKRGRPTKEAREVKSQYLRIRVSPAAQEAYQAAADRESKKIGWEIPLAEWIRKSLDDAARRSGARRSPAKEGSPA